MMQGRNDAPDLTTIVVTWRNAEIVGRCLAAIESAAVRVTQEVIVVDNGSDDGTAEAAAAASASARIVKLRENRGFAAATNVAISMARGRFLGLVNSDCVPDPVSLDVLGDVSE